MGEGMLGHISKGVVLKKVDALVNHADAKGQFDKREAFLAALTSATDAVKYQDILEKQAGVTIAESNYLKSTWYSAGAGSWWPDPQSVFAIVLRGLIKAIQEAGKDRRLDSYWLPVAGAGVFEVIVCRSEQQVTRIILTPPSPAPTRKRTTNVPIWTVKRRSAYERVADETNDEVVEAVNGDAVTWQVRELS